ncbi:MAG: outer membrane protein assembly factor BamB family protein [Limisphaerales bacterium]
MKATNLLFTLLAASTALFAADWPQYRGPSHDGKTPEKMSVWPANGPKALWKIPTPNGFSSFAVKDGRAYTIVGREADGVPREVLIALDAATGKELWSVPFGSTRYGHDGGNAGTRNNKGGDGPRSTPVLDGDRVYVLTADLVLAAFQAKDGKEIWKRDLIKENKADNITWKNAASPVIDGDLVFVAGGGSGQSLLGINKNNGQVVWKGESDKITHATPVPATIHGVRQIIFFTQKGLVSVQPQDGKVLWRHKHGYSTSTAASPVVGGDIVFCSAGYGVGASAAQIKKNGDKFTATQLWSTSGDSLANHWSTPIHKDGFLYGMFQFKEYGDGPIKCVDIKTGEVKWSQPGFGPGNVIMVDNQLVALSDAGELIHIDPSPARYQQKARFQAVTGKCWSTPAFSQGRIYVRSTKESAAFDLSQKLAQP